MARYICLNCGLEIEKTAPDIVDGAKTRAVCPGCGSEDIGLAVPCPICGVLMPDHWTVCEYCEAQIRSYVEGMMLLHKPKNRKAAVRGYAEIVRKMAEAEEAQR